MYCLATFVNGSPALMRGAQQRWQTFSPSVSTLTARLVWEQNALKLKAGDILIFAKLANGELLLGGRTRTSADKDRKAPPRARKGSEQGANGTSAGGLKRPRPMNGSGPPSLPLA